MRTVMRGQKCRVILEADVYELPLVHCAPFLNRSCHFLDVVGALGPDNNSSVLPIVATAVTPERAGVSSSLGLTLGCSRKTEFEVDT